MQPAVALIKAAGHRVKYGVAGDDCHARPGKRAGRVTSPPPASLGLCQLARAAGDRSNLLAIGQLDSGQIADAMLGRVHSTAIGTAALFALVLLCLFLWSGLLTRAFVVYFIAGGKGSAPLNDISRIGVGRLAVGAIAFVLLFLILTPVPHRLYDALGIHGPYL